jgi:hypothetical protein
MQHLGPNVQNQKAQALQFVRGVRLPQVLRLRTRSANTEAKNTELKFDSSSVQAAVVGSDLVSFGKGVPVSIRHDVINCSLLAQLAANREVRERGNLEDWYNTYFDTLANIGWLIQERGFAQYHREGNDFEANKAILLIAATLFGGASTALAVINSTLHAMESVASGPWLTIFKRESQHDNVGRFQITVAEANGPNDVMLGLMAFELVAKAELDQLLFFKLLSSEVILRHSSGRVTINKDIMETVSGDIHERLKAYTTSFVAELPI